MTGGAAAALRRRAGRALRGAVPAPLARAAGLRAAPDFLIVGAQKAGTTSLHHMLDQAPHLRGAAEKEVGHFSRDARFGATLADYEARLAAGPRAGKARGALVFESTPEHLAWPGIADRVADAYPGIRAVAVLREPAARAYSAWTMYDRLWREGAFESAALRRAAALPGHRLRELLLEGRGGIRPFRECLEIELELIRAGGADFEPALIRRGLYLDLLRPWLRRFGRDRTLILGFGTLGRDPQGCADRICDFLGVPRFRLEAAEARNVNRYAAPMAAEDRALLEEIYAGPNRALLEEIGPIDW